jgi:hypothetical protein
MAKKTLAHYRLPNDATLEARIAYLSERPPLTGCQLWLAATDRDGYGVLSINDRQRRANRVVLELKIGRPLGYKMHSLHTCHNPRCVNPDHLYEGTNDENMADKVRAGRQYRQFGELCPTAKLTTSQVVAIISDKRLQRIIATEMGVSEATVSLIKRGKLWPHIPR